MTLSVIVGVWLVHCTLHNITNCNLQLITIYMYWIQCTCTRVHVHVLYTIHVYMYLLHLFVHTFCVGNIDTRYTIIHVSIIFYTNFIIIIIIIFIIISQTKSMISFLEDIPGISRLVRTVVIIIIMYMYRMEPVYITVTIGSNICYTVVTLNRSVLCLLWGDWGVYMYNIMNIYS